MLTAMFAKLPSLSETEGTGSPKANDGADDGHAGSEQANIAGHGTRALDWHSLRAKLSAERDLRGSLRGENEAMASWIRAEGSFDPRAAEALCSQGHNPASDTTRSEGDALEDEKPTARLPDPKPSAHITASGYSVPAGKDGTASGLNVEE